MTDKNWKQKLQDKMAHYEEPAPDGLWESIEREMPAVAPTHTDRRHTVSLWVGRLAGAAAAIAIVVLLGKVWRNTSTEVTLTPMANTEVAPSPTISATPHTTDILSEKPATTILSTRIPEAPRLLAKADVQQAMPLEDAMAAEEAMAEEDVMAAEDAMAKAESVVPVEEAREEADVAKAARNETKATETPARTTTTKVQRTNTSLWPSTPIVSRQTKSGRLTANLYASGATTDRRIQRSYELPYGNTRYADYGNQKDLEVDGDYTHGAGAAQGGISNEITDPDVSYPGINNYSKNGIAENSAMVRSTSNRAFIESSYADYKSELKHHQPLRGGISLRYSLSDRVAIESGVTYTRMESEASEGKTVATEGRPDNYYHTTQTLHYIGIPVNVLYTVWERKAFEVYVLGGGMVEKNVKGKQETTYTVSEQEIVHQNHSFTEKPLQWSVNTGAGLQFNLNDAFGVYAEPGVSYYIDNNSKVDNYYKDKPWSFNLKVGLRYSFNR